MAVGNDILCRGLIVSMTIGGKPYLGVVVKYETLKHFVVKIAKVDNSLVQVVPNIECSVKCIADDGKAYGFKSRLKDQKIPMVTLSYPEGELQGVSVRKAERVSVSFWAEIKVMVDSRLKAIGDANMVSMSLGGCKIMTQQKLKRGDPVWIEFIYGENDEKILFKATVRNSKPALYESTYLGLQYGDMEDSTMEKIKQIIENPQG